MNINIHLMRPPAYKIDVGDRGDGGPAMDFLIRSVYTCTCIRFYTCVCIIWNYKLK